MTPEQLNTIQARADDNRLPPAPWRWHYYSQYREDDRGTLHAPCTPSIIAGDVDEVTGWFMAKAREDIPALLDEVRRLQEENDKLNRWVNATKNHAPYEAAGATWQIRHDNDQAKIERLQGQVEALVGLVRDAYVMDPYCHDDDSTGAPLPFDESDAAMNLNAILNGAESEGG